MCGVVVELAKSTKARLDRADGVTIRRHYRRYIEPLRGCVGRLDAPEGVWAVLGNHDHLH
jgi:hypothetical protein